MALQGKLQIGSAAFGLIPGAGRLGGYGIVECAYEFNQSVDESGKPTSRPRGGIITFVTPTPEDGDTFFYNWMFDKTQTHDGTFTFIVYGKNNMRCYKTVQFSNAYCIGLKEYFNDNDSRLMYTTVTISAEIITVSGVSLDNKW